MPTTRFGELKIIVAHTLPIQKDDGNLIRSNKQKEFVAVEYLRTNL